MSAPRCSECGAVRTTSEEPFTLDAAPGTRHHRLLTSNEVPLASDESIVKSVISTARARLALVEREIAQLRDRMKSLKEERTSLSRHIGIVSPLRRMPPEVLGEIFSWTLPSVGELRQTNFGIADSPWVLTYVSSHWRAVALSLPSLWSLFVVEFPEKIRPLPMVKAHIQRAHSLKIHFYGEQASDPRPQIELFRCLAEHSARWQELSIGLTSDLFPLLTGLNRLTSLCRLSIEWNDPDSQAEVESVDCFQSAPSLVDVAIYNQYRYVPTLLPAHQLTRYDIDGPWEMHRGILTLAPNLVQARIYVNFNEGDWPESDEIIHLPRLQRLFVSHDDILECLRAPVLQEIVFDVPEEADLDYPLPLDPFMSRSGCTLRKLSFRRLPPTHAVVEVLQKYASVTELTIIHHLDTRANDLISQLTFPNSTGRAAISPQLSKISFAFAVDSYTVDYTRYLDMLKSRWNAADCALRSAVLLTDSGKGPDPATLRGLDALRQDGMNILVLDGEETSRLIDSWTYTPTWIS
ncbi:hypothetical protein C8R44DRAFT_341636 [Mycena epipterygia]|nr:hypothetical protein C8R44DRAFT_341636 [Mycena epipterygia]